MHLQPSNPTAPTSDLQLLEAWRAGDLDAGAILFERHYRSIHGYFSNRVGRDCEDLIQATFLGCLESIPRFRGESSFRTLLFAIARFKLLKHLRERNRDNKFLDPNPITLAAERRSATSVLDACTQREQLVEAMRRLPSDTQLMLELFYWQAMPVKAIAAMLELPVNTVKTRMRRAREQLVREIHA